MWILHDDLLMFLPDGAPTPPNSRPISVPDDFVRNPRAWDLRDGQFVPRPAPTPTPKLTADEVTRLKEMLAGSAPPAADATERRATRRRKEDR